MYQHVRNMSNRWPKNPAPGDGVAELQTRAAEALGLNPCQVALHTDGVPLTNDLIRAEMCLGGKYGDK